MKYKTSDLAKAAAIKYYDGFCVMSGLNKSVTAIAGSHIWPAGSTPELKTWSENIIPLRFNLHTNGDNTFDWVVFQKTARTPIEKVYWLIDNGIRPEFKRKVMQQLLDLSDIMSNSDTRNFNLVEED